MNAPLSPAQDRRLYETDRAAWYEQAAPRLVQQWRERPAKLTEDWPRLSDDYRLVLWALMTDAEKRAAWTLTPESGREMLRKRKEAA